MVPLIFRVARFGSQLISGCSTGRTPLGWAGQMNSSKRDISAVVFGILLILPLTIAAAWAVMVAIDHFVLGNPDALLAQNSSQLRPPTEAASPSDFSARRSNSKAHRDRLLRELREAK